MKIIKPRDLVVFFMVALSGAALLHASQNVQQAESRLRALEDSVRREEERVHLLRAEWESLNRPERLERLAREFLELASPAPETLVGEVSALPAVQDELPVMLMNDEHAYSPVLHDVAFGASDSESVNSGGVESSTAAPLRKMKAEKTFGELLGELEEGRE